MLEKIEDPAALAARTGSGISSRLAGLDSSENTTSLPALQAKIEILREEILDTIGSMQASLDAAKAMAEIPSDQGILHGLRVAHAHGKALWSHASDLKGAHAELASILRQSEGAS